MNDEFWHKCWKNNTIGFHQEAAHPFLESQFKPLLNIQNEQPCKLTPQNIFVPLCGKSLDMWWLANYGKVIGTDLSRIACRDFFLEQKISPKTEELGQFTRYSANQISLYHGDVFLLSPAQLPNFKWIYDRAAIIAMPPESQKAYVDKLTSFMQPDTKIFLLSLEFPQSELSGPPFSTSTKQITALFDGYNCEKIIEHELKNKQFAQRRFEVSRLIETLYIISNK